ncbi:MAG: C2H2-type zinc finger protein [Candidatus Babeliales bacterium]
MKKFMSLFFILTLQALSFAMEEESFHLDTGNLAPYLDLALRTPDDHQLGSFFEFVNPPVNPQPSQPLPPFLPLLLPAPNHHAGNFNLAPIHPFDQTHPATSAGPFKSRPRLRLQQELLAVTAAQAQQAIDAPQNACHLCTKRYKYANELRRHILSHLNKREFYCDFEDCSSAFNDETALRNHKKQHDPLKSYECKGCGKFFKSRHALKNHERVHTGETPFRCLLCDKLFQTSSNCGKHIRKKHMRKAEQNTNFIEIQTQTQDESQI